MFRQLLATLALVACTAFPTAAGQILYATAAIEGRVDGFCVRDNGGLALSASRQKATIDNPRRVIVSGDALYVAGANRVEAFKIDAAGRLTSLGRTGFTEGANPRDIAVDPARRMLYMPQRNQDRIVAYPLTAEGGFASEDFTSCARGPVFSDWENLIFDQDRLYATALSGGGEVLVYGVDADGNLPITGDDPAAVEAACRRNSTGEITEPLSNRQCIAGAGALLVQDGVLYVSARVRRRILSFDLASDGLFVPAVPIGTGGCKKIEQQDVSSRTKEQSRYLDIVRHGDTIFASFFEGGRVHAFPLVERDGRVIDLPKRRKRKTGKNLIRTPARMTTAISADGSRTLYVSGGDLNRIEAFRLVDTDKGLLMNPKPFSRTLESRRSFPNDVVVTTISDACGE